MNQERDRQLTDLQQEIRSCTRCVTAGYLIEANPVFRGRPGNRQMIVGQAPGLRGHRSGVPWSGISGDLLTRWFASAGFEAETFLEDWYFTSLTRCFPGKARSGSGDRAPSAVERALCRPWLDTELALVQPPLIVTLGRMAANAIIPGANALTLRDLVGRRWNIDVGYGEVAVVPLPHPSGVGRWLNDPANRLLVDRALEVLGDVRVRIAS